MTQELFNIYGFGLTGNVLLTVGLASIAALAAVGVVAFNNTVRSALSLVTVFFMLALMYFTMSMEMIGITQIVVYLGAIMVLVLFVVMLLNLQGQDLKIEQRDPKLLVGGLLGLAMFGLLASQLAQPMLKMFVPTLPEGYERFGGPEAIGRTLFTLYVFPFEVTSVLLLIGLVGSIMLAKRRIL